ncbi:protein tyrosine phosphatase receptor type C-associated protein [Sceloporus undulatus]|uniref:protein tyrosine phosphatase receptor type C-associated protein n=1 Tax=Sceloporus undulatus TaxID=8520 RepID=UPI001C4CE1F5|nr:protein tyrosine phosphatase receptor type C-associated protein [Sceloporus undulatus]
MMLLFHVLWLQVEGAKSPLSLGQQFILVPVFLQRLTHAVLVVFLLIPGEVLSVASQRGGVGNKRDDAVVGLLVFTLLLLLILLFLAWRHLSLKSEGRYHPQHLMRRLVLRWQNFWGQIHSEELSHGYQDEEQSDEELGECQSDDAEEEQQTELLFQQAENEGEEERQEMFNKSTTPEPLEKRVELEPSEEEEEDMASKAAEGRAETLLSDLHSFSGTATWEDSGKQAHVTAL